MTELEKIARQKIAEAYARGDSKLAWVLGKELEKIQNTSK